MTDAPNLEPAALDELIAATKALLDFPGGAYAPALENRAKRAMDAALAARSAPEAGKAVEEEPIGWAYQDKRWDKGRWHVCGLDSKPRAHEGREIRAIYIASNGTALASSPAPTGAEDDSDLPTAEDVRGILGPTKGCPL